MNIEELRKEKERLEDQKETEKLKKEIFDLKHGDKINKAKSLGSMLLPKSAVKGDLVKLKCAGCSRGVTTYAKHWRDMSCKDCGGVFEQIK